MFLQIQELTNQRDLDFFGNLTKIITLGNFQELHDINEISPEPIKDFLEKSEKFFSKVSELKGIREMFKFRDLFNEIFETFKEMEDLTSGVADLSNPEYLDIVRDNLSICGVWIKETINFFECTCEAFEEQKQYLNNFNFWPWG